MEKNNNNNHGGGFLLGVIVGVIITLLFTTKRGREIFKDLTEKGLEKFSDFETLLKEIEKKQFVEEDEENDYIKPEPVQLAPQAPSPAPTPPSPAPKPVEAVRPVTKVEVVEVKKVMPASKPKPEPKEEKPVPAPKPKEEPVKAEVIHEVLEEEKPDEKASHGRRWFRGLKKKS